jgi:Glycosyl hydrolase family 95 catalytic domain
MPPDTACGRWEARGSARICGSILLSVEEPKHHWLVTPFSMSPEHGYLDGDGKMAFLSPAPTMDIAIIRELFPHCIEAGKLLGVDEDFRGKLEAALKRLPPYQINHLGYLQEWIEDWQSGNQGHNCSPNFPIYPGSSITLRGTPELAAAIAKWMETRRPRGGFPSAWYISVWTRLERGDKVDEFISAFVANAPGPNLHNKGANQSDASFGFTAGVAEALLQSHGGRSACSPRFLTAGEMARSQACGPAADLKSACSGRTGSWFPHKSAATTAALARCDTAGRPRHCNSRPVRRCT